MSFEDLEKYLGQQAGVILEFRKLQTDMSTVKRNEGTDMRVEVWMGVGDVHEVHSSPSCRWERSNARRCPLPLN
jgi:hypothetical protein